MDKKDISEIYRKITANPFCYLTGTKIDLTDSQSYEFDHIIPKSRGGKNDLNNLGLCTRTANRCKTNLTPEEFLELCKQVVRHHENKNDEPTYEI